ncbi:signal peptidase I [Kiloniella litopenaei]|uniref:signal peptidase I n=1 Tax=Kiloniella litopenaei TaxID=1549748 RepID=UPI003BAA930D
MLKDATKLISALGCIFLLLIISFYFSKLSTVKIASNSMAPNLLEGDIVLTYQTAPELGDILLIEDISGKPFAKRLVALNGDKICYSGNQFTRKNNYKELMGKYIDSHGNVYEMYQELSGEQYYNTIYTPIFDPTEHCISVPENNYFFLGDNRTRSVDSRIRDFPRLSEGEAYPKLVFIIYANDFSRIFQIIR